MRLLSSILLFLVSILFIQCQKEVSNIGAPDPVITLPNPITAKLQGNILDENGLPAAGVVVNVGLKTTTTNTTGYFVIVNAALDKNASLVTAEKTGYFKAYRTFSATSGANQVVIKLIKKTLAGTIDAAAGGNVTLPNGSKIALTANSVVKVSGNTAYAGSVNVYAAYIDPTAADIDQTVPGSFIANDKNGSRVLLSSYGMVAVELESASAEKLQIKSGAVATLTTPIPASIQASAPNNIALWSIDETTGVWKEEGTATKIGNAYIGDVSHFSFWNCDVSVNAIVLSMTLKTPNGQPLHHAHVKIKRTGSNPTQSHGWTDSLGQVSGYVPGNEALILEVLDPCNNVIFTQNIGPFATNTNLGIITVTISAGSLVNFTGILINCAGGIVTSGYAIVYYENMVHYASVNSSGTFTTNFTVCSSSATTAQILAVDSTNQQQGNLTTVTVTTPITNVGNVIACGISAAQFINYTIDATSYTISSQVSGDSLFAFTSNVQGTTNLQTIFSGSHLSNSFFLMFNHPTPTVGTYPVLTFQVNVGSSGNTTIIQPFNVTITNYATVAGEFYEGTYSGSFSNVTGIHTTSGSFRLRRN
ncbi:MAG: hypothetical protein WKF35_13135 [Ferruginibacter sp.]